MKPQAADRRAAPLSRHAGWDAPAALASAGAPVAPLQSQRLSDQLAALLIQQIERGEHKPGDRIPTEAQLASRHGVSRSVVREAVHQVKSRGMVQSRQGSGVYVSLAPAAAPLEFDPGVLTSLDAVLEVVELRRVLEGEMAALAAERATRAQVSTLRRCLKAIDEANRQGRDGLPEDLAFHRSIGAATGNAQFTLMLGFLEQYLTEAMRVTKGNELRRDDFMRAVRDEHKQIVDAIARGDAKAARRAAITHLRNGETRLVVGGVIPADARRAAAPRAAALR